MVDNQTAHTHKGFATNCFNAAWEYLNNSSRTPDDTETMLHLAHSSFWHWTQVQDHTPQNLSIGLWQLARVYAVAGLPDRATYFADRCIRISEGSNLPPFYIGYGYEALARAKSVAGEKTDAISLVDNARSLAAMIEDIEERKILLDDLNTIV